MRAFWGARSTSTSPATTATICNADGAERLYNIYRYEKDDTQMHMVFRDHRLSDLIGFVYSGMPARGRCQAPHPKH